MAARLPLVKSLLRKTPLPPQEWRTPLRRQSWRRGRPRAGVWRRSWWRWRCLPPQTDVHLPQQTKLLWKETALLSFPHHHHDQCHEGYFTHPHLGKRAPSSHFRPTRLPGSTIENTLCLKNKLIIFAWFCLNHPSLFPTTHLHVCKTIICCQFHHCHPHVIISSSSSPSSSPNFGWFVHLMPVHFSSTININHHIW